MRFTYTRRGKKGKTSDVGRASDVAELARPLEESVREGL